MDKNNSSLIGRNLYIPRMSIEGASTLAAVFRSYGVNGQLAPESDEHSLELARQFTIGEECFPEIVTLGGFLKVMEQDDFDPQKTAFMMPTATGPCRFGQYYGLLKMILHEKGLEQVMVVSPTSDNGYEGMGIDAKHLFRQGWWGVVCGDVLRKLLLQTRPYEKNKGEADRVHSQGLFLLCSILERDDMDMKQKFVALVHGLESIVDDFSRIPANYHKEKLLVGIVGEIFCRLDEYSNSNLIRIIEKYGGEVWIAGIAEWIFYVNFMQKTDLIIDREKFSKNMLGAIIKDKIQAREEHRLFKPAHERFIGYQEPENIKVLLKSAEKYLPYTGALGEMVLNLGGAIYMHNIGADGVVDISPFTCMNGIVCEAIYPNLSNDYDHIPIRNFYFDGTCSDYERDVEIFLELASTYKRRKKNQRVFPPHFLS